MNKKIIYFLSCFISLLAGYTINIILFGTEKDVNHWTHRISLLLGILIGSVIGAIMLHYFDKKGLLFKNKKDKRDNKNSP